jgi:hypothetical protein
MRCDVARNTYAADLLKSEHTHLLMLDSDHIHPPDIVQRLARWMVEDPARLVVGGLNFRRGEPFDPCAYVKDEDGAVLGLTDWGDLVECHSIGTGCILISREVFERIPPPWFGYDVTAFPEYPSDDIFFCNLCRQHDIKLFCDTTTTSPHLIESAVGKDTFVNYFDQRLGGQHARS